MSGIPPHGSTAARRLFTQVEAWLPQTTRRPPSLQAHPTIQWRCNGECDTRALKGRVSVQTKQEMPNSNYYASASKISNLPNGC